LLTPLQPADNLVVNTMNRRGQVLVKEARSNVADDDMAQLANGQRSGSVISVNFLKVPVAEADVRFGAQSGLKSDIARGPKSADTVAKVENRTTLKISRKLIFGLLCCCVAF
jgi:hypothetical protein